MLPTDNIDYDIEDVSIINFDVRQEPSKTFKLNIEKNRVDGICDDVELSLIHISEPTRH